MMERREIGMGWGGTETEIRKRKPKGIRDKGRENDTDWIELRCICTVKWMIFHLMGYSFGT